MASFVNDEYRSKVSAYVTQNPRRPILTHLNVDNSWLISFPVPSRKANSKTDRAYYHLLVDAWLDGTITVFHRWFMTFTHRFVGAFQSVQAVQEFAALIDEEAGGSNGKIDAVLASHDGPDHCHKDTLIHLDPSTPIITTGRAAKIVTSWNHFKNVKIMPNLENPTTPWDWRQDHTASLPSWISIANVSAQETFPALHFATLITYRSGDGDSAEAILHTPHGITSEKLQFIETAQPKVETLALLCGINEKWYGPKANLGIDSGIALQKQTHAKYWIPTHEEDLTYTGLNGYLQTMKAWTIDAVWEKYHDLTSANEHAQKDPFIMKEIGNGESLVLV